MRWKDLAFLHWPVDPDALRSLVPAALELETWEGDAWLGITPFEMCDVRPRLVPPLPGVSRFPELNVRTYVSIGGKPGIWFFSLDAGSRLAVRAARFTFGLPYHAAAMGLAREGGEARFDSVRSPPHAGRARFRAVYRPDGPVTPAKEGTLEHWFTERYCLYSLRGDRLLRGEIHHAPWPLQPAEARVSQNTMTDGLGLALRPTPARMHYAAELHVVAWLPTRVEG